MEDNCVFCKIVKGELPSYKVYEDDEFLAFLDIFPFNKGHTLVIPKRHHRFVWDVEHMDRYIKVVNKIADHYRFDLGYEFVDMMAFGRKVEHAHIQLVPNSHSDVDYHNGLSGLNLIQQDKSKNLTKEVAEDLLQKLKV